MTTLTPTPRRRRSGCGRALLGRSRCRSLQGRRCLLLIGYVGAVKRLAALCHFQCLEDGIGGENFALAGLWADPPPDANSRCCAAGGRRGSDVSTER